VKKTDRSDDAVGHAMLRDSAIVRSGNVFSTLINRRRRGEELSDDPFLDSTLARTEAHGSGLVDKKTQRPPLAGANHSSAIRQVDVKAVSGRSRIVENRAPSVNAQSPRHRKSAERSAVAGTAPATGHDQMRRLQTAMKSDRRGTLASDQTDAHAAKVRVGHMMQDVRSLRLEGKLSDAYLTALSARELAKNSRLFFGPDEEQPGDLVHQLRRELRAAKHEQSSGTPTIATVQPEPVQPEPAGAASVRSPAGMPFRRRPVKERLGPPPDPEFIPPKLSLSLARKPDQTPRSDEPVSTEGTALVRQSPSERVEILSPAPQPSALENHSPSRTIALKPAVSARPSVQPQVLTNGIPAPSVRPGSSDRPLIVPDESFLPNRANSRGGQSTRRTQTTAVQVRQTSMTVGDQAVVKVSEQRDAVLHDARSIWDRETEPAVLVPSLSTVSQNETPLRSARQQRIRPAPAPPGERSVADPVGDGVASHPDDTSNDRAKTGSGSSPAMVSIESVDWSDHSTIDDDPATGPKQSLLWLALSIVVGCLMGVGIRAWTRFRRKAAHSRNS